MTNEDQVRICGVVTKGETEYNFTTLPQFVKVVSLEYRKA